LCFLSHLHHRLFWCDNNW